MTDSATVSKLPDRNEIAPADTWDLGSLFADDATWETAFAAFEQKLDQFAQYAGTLSDSAEELAACLAFDAEVDREGESIGIYAFLKTTEDQSNSEYQGMMGRFHSVAARPGQAASFIRPEILAIPEERMNAFLADDATEPYRLALDRMLRYRPHTLSQNEEKLLAMQSEMSQTAQQAFSQLNNADLKFGFVDDGEGGQRELSNSTLMEFLISPKRDIRETAFRQYYEQFAGHENTLAALLGGSIHKDVYHARARGYDNALSAALFPDNVPQSVYDNLIASVQKRLPAVHRYYDVRRRKMGLDDIHHYDTYVPVLSDLELRREWDEAVGLIITALAPLGDDYCQVLEKGLRGRWCDRYPNQGKQSGAFSCGSFDGAPYILMNYKPKVLNDVFTLAHEAGHSMHSFYSAGNQPFLYYDYAIFVAEVASTFNEELLSHHMLNQARDDKERAYLINLQIDDIRGTIVRQTMFAEFEKLTHEMAENGEALTVDAFKTVYQGLLSSYFGPEFVLDDELSLECFRIPHFYRAFYVYKYATGLSAAIALSKRVLEGGPSELEDYLGFLKGGCSKYPLDLLRDAGVDMEQPEPVDTALAHFESLVDELDELL